jgi:DNA-binding MarR family transcriptional regulator/GNAT superfamily N-acetyltransferase
MDAIDTIRAFNRATLARVGRIEAAYAEEGVSLPEARVLVEVERLGPVPARVLGEALGLNEGYLSRLVSGLARRGLVIREVGREDRRARPVRLGPEGAALAARLGEVSRRGVAGWFDGADPGAMGRVASHLAQVEAELGGRASDAVDLTPLRLGDIGWLTQQHAEGYARDEGFDGTFEPLVARILADFADGHDPACERGWIARAGEVRLGSIFCVKGPEPGLAKLRLFFLVPEARGLGLGRRLLDTCVSFAMEAGYRRMTLWTHESHRAACALYAKAGFACVRSDPVTSFGVDLVEQEWARDF